MLSVESLELREQKKARDKSGDLGFGRGSASA